MHGIPPHNLLWRLLRHVTPIRVWICVAVLAVAVIAIAIIFVPWHRKPPPAAECGQPLVLVEAVAPDIEPTISGLASRFQDSHRDPTGCPRYSMLVYQATLGDMVRALHQQWSPDSNDRLAEGYFQPTRDVGPEPDGWIPGSSAEAWLAGANDAEAIPRLRLGKPLGWTEPVVAIPDELLAQLPPGTADRPWSWGELRPVLRDHTIGLVRPNPATSTAGLLHTMALYSGMDPASGDIRQLEQEISGNVGQGGYPAGGEVELLCHQPSQQQRVAFLVSAQTLHQYRGRACSSRAYQQLSLSRVPGLDHPYVALSWPGRLEQQRRTAGDDFEHWLRTDLAAVNALHDATGARPGMIADRTATNQVWAEYQSARANGRVLIAVDRSAPMAESGLHSNVGSPLEAATVAVRQSLTLLGTADKVGVWTFAGRPNGFTITKLIALGPLTADKRAKLADLEISADSGADRSPLYQVVDEGLQELTETRPSSAADVSALIVIVDGSNLNSGEKLVSLQDRLPDAGNIPVYVLAIRASACYDLSRDLAKTVGGACTTTQPDSLIDDLHTRLAGLWKGASS